MATTKQSEDVNKPSLFQFPWSSEKREVGEAGSKGGNDALRVVSAQPAVVVAVPPQGGPLPVATGGRPRKRWGKLTTQYDSDTNVFQNKLSTKLWAERVKLKASWDFLPEERSFVGPTLGLFTKVFSCQLNVPEGAPFVTFTQPLGQLLKLRYEHDIKVRAIVCQPGSGDLIPHWRH
jgi:hypothetical protein